MLNLSLVIGLLFTVNIGTNASYFSSHLSNSNNHLCFASYVTSNNITSMVNDPTNIKIGSFNDGEYISVIKLSFPNYQYNLITRSSLELFKESGYAGSIKIAYNYNFDFNANSSILPDNYTWTYYSTLSFQGNSFYSNLTNLIKNSINANKNNIYLKLYYDVTNYSTVIGNNQYPSVRPIFNVIYNSTPSSNTYGNATYCASTTSLSYHVTNCYGYAFDVEGGACGSLFIDLADVIVTDTSIESVFLPRIINYSKNSLNINTRKLDAYNSPIFSFERRIAFRFKLNGNYGSVHFIRQHANETWSCVYGYTGAAPSVCSYTDDLSDYNWNSNPNSSTPYYDSDTYFLAISTLGGCNYYHAY